MRGQDWGSQEHGQEMDVETRKSQCREARAQSVKRLPDSRRHGSITPDRDRLA